MGRLYCGYTNVYPIGEFPLRNTTKYVCIIIQNLVFRVFIL